MSIQKIMTPFLNEATGEAAFKSSAPLAQRFKAHLDVIHMRQRITPAVSGSAYYPIAITYVEESIKELRKAADEQAENLKALFERLCTENDFGVFEEEEHTEDKGATAAWADVDATMPYDLANRARVSDIVILAKSNENASPLETDIIEEMLFQSGRAVLLVNTENPLLQMPKTVVVAWNGGREAARALSCALPILKQAKEVVVLSVGDLPWATEPPENVAAYLRLHGVHASHVMAGLNKGVDPEEEFLAQAKKKKADLIVMGAYSHTRWREILLGGFTRHLMDESEIPLLMAH